MGYGSTSILTPEIAKGVAEEWSDGKSFRKIAKALRKDGHTLSHSDITNWCKNNTVVEICDESIKFGDFMLSLWGPRIMNMINESIEIVDKAARNGDCPHHARNMAHVRFCMMKLMIPKWAPQAADLAALVSVLPYNPRMHKASKDADVN